MNKLFLILVIGFTLVCQSEFNKVSEFNIVGKWEWESYSSSGNFVFYSNEIAEMESENEKIGGKDFMRNGKKFSLEYKIDYNKTPKTLDLIFTELESKKQLKMPGIIDIVEKDILLYARGKNGIRPKSIAESDDKITLYRIK
ncbi:hypothetical protein [Mesoflavibacter sp. SCSIO 43206]|uniref:hypothetical protein n=1 Tax=Mesoflavibacter sp. SCSIO 43206 TaxID=2779362 RepID=UPI001CA7D6D0|nr:hypothetical protein [Mesoflavibacter sp. SCSIO 43206]UAB75608.1 hypothetical protein INR78_01065 [Mesoflavibacter sp. SCSIO 43206]